MSNCANTSSDLSDFFLQYEAILNKNGSQDTTISYKGPGSRLLKELQSMTPEERRMREERFKLAEATVYVPSCLCKEAEEEYQSVLRGGEKLNPPLECQLHPENFKKVPARKKKHTIPERFAYLLRTERYFEPNSAPLDPIEKMEFTTYMKSIYDAGFEVKYTPKGVPYLINKHDPYGVLTCYIGCNLR
ncbi:hypothetical protein SCHPADRAFT_355072 [Schizopora paradoxa]|uniref:Uncharacterized protein n=1 Tax=Schizopora paradoxa TaxID=27342 RepID=A0A0H2RPN7_9AGAM|nr:hypothetical protein SCHPADRAFT_355072 [Schizopora paradoxa]